MIRWLPPWARRWLLQQLSVAEVRSRVTVLAESTLIALWRVRAPMLELIEQLADAGHPHDLIVEQVTRQLTLKRPELDRSVLRAALGIWVADELADLGATPVVVPLRTLGPAGARASLEVVEDTEEDTGALPMPTDDPPEAA